MKKLNVNNRFDDTLLDFIEKDDTVFCEDGHYYV